MCPQHGGMVLRIRTENVLKKSLLLWITIEAPTGFEYPEHGYAALLISSEM